VIPTSPISSKMESVYSSYCCFRFGVFASFKWLELVQKFYHRGAEAPAGRYYRPCSSPVSLMVFLLSVLRLRRSESRPEVKEKFRLGRTSGANHQKFRPWMIFCCNSWILGDLFKGNSSPMTPNLLSSCLPSIVDLLRARYLPIPPMILAYS
jgi:hypothetical protein